MMKRGIIVASFGTTHRDTLELSIESIERKIGKIFEKDRVLRAFTSRLIISRLKKRYDYSVDNPIEALEKLKNEKIKKVYIQPILIIPGHEYNKLIKEVEEFAQANKDMDIKIGKPLLYDDKDYEDVIDALDLSKDIEGQASIYMGHGTYHRADYVYDKLEKIIRGRGYDNVFIGTVEGEKTIEDIVDKLLDRGIEHVTLKPFMFVAGDHAKNDMASDDEDSWKSVVERKNIEVGVEMKALGEIQAIQDIFIQHLEEIID